jgi:hypothetical protein
MPANGTAFALGLDPRVVMTNASNSTVTPLPGRAHSLPPSLTGWARLLSCYRTCRRGRAARGQVDSLVLEEIEVAPSHPLGVVGRAVRRAAGRAGEAAFPGQSRS